MSWCNCFGLLCQLLLCRKMMWHVCCNCADSAGFTAAAMAHLVFCSCICSCCCSVRVYGCNMCSWHLVTSPVVRILLQMLLYYHCRRCWCDICMCMHDVIIAVTGWYSIWHCSLDIDQPIYLLTDYSSNSNWVNVIAAATRAWTWLDCECYWWAVLSR